jgi:hypothetical protein
MGEMKKISKNKEAERIVGLRNLPPGAIPFDQPCELGYHCPICEYLTINKNQAFDERLQWSEYEGFLWCSVCNKDYPSCICIPFNRALPKYVTKKSPADYAIELYLRSIESAKNLRIKK